MTLEEKHFRRFYLGKNWESCGNQEEINKEATNKGVPYKYYLLYFPPFILLCFNTTKKGFQSSLRVIPAWSQMFLYFST
jgi:hypothetical protein